jgi:hypothetical protein
MVLCRRAPPPTRSSPPDAGTGRASGSRSERRGRRRRNNKNETSERLHSMGSTAHACACAPARTRRLSDALGGLPAVRRGCAPPYTPTTSTTPGAGLTSMELGALNTWVEHASLNGRKFLLCVSEDLQVPPDDCVFSECAVNNMICAHGAIAFQI